MNRFSKIAAIAAIGFSASAVASQAAVLDFIDYIDFPPIGDKPPASSRSASANLLMIFSPEF